jgi:TetR/AcrR family transcriptional repressor of nem operon
VEFRRGGIAGTGVADVMTAAGLTQGGFYRHFESKEALVTESLTNSFDAMRGSIQRSMDSRRGGAAMVAAIEDYLSIAHRDSAVCCPFVSLGGELAREGSGARAAASTAFKNLADVFARNFSALSPANASKEATIIVSTMIGAMTVARLIPDTDLSAAVLAHAKRRLSEQVRRLA